MVMKHTIQNRPVKARVADITIADTTVDGIAVGSRLTEITERDIFEFGTDANDAVITFTGEAVDGDTFDGFIWGVTQEGVAEAIAEISGTAGTAIYDGTDQGSSDRLFIDTVNIKQEFHVKEVTVADNGNNRYAKVGFDIVGLCGVYICVTAVGAAGQVDRLTPWVRTF
jgi:hypothetical protein